MQDFGKVSARQKKSPRDPGGCQMKMMQQSAVSGPDLRQPQDLGKDEPVTYEPRLADYFAIIGLEDEILPIDGGAECK